MQHTVLRLTPEQKRRQYIAAPAIFAVGLVFAFMGSRTLSDGNVLIGAAVLGVALLFVDLGMLQWLLVFSFVRYDDATLSWRTHLRTREVAWSEVGHVEVVRIVRHETDRLRVHRHGGGNTDLPVVAGVKGAWRDPQFEAKAEQLIEAWREYVRAHPSGRVGPQAV